MSKDVDEDSPFEPEMVIDRFQLLQRLGRGVQAEVWAVRNLDFSGQNLAVKLWYSRTSERAEHAFQEKHSRLDKEARLLAGVDSAHIIAPLYRIGDMLTINDVDYTVFGIVLALATEGNLDEFLKGKGSDLPMLERVRLMEQLANGLIDLQHANVVHNDIKPQNILVSKREAHYSARFGDFGIAFKKGEPTVGGGTIAYMAPELLGDVGRPSFNAEASFKTDIFSLGIVFFELLLGRHPLEEVIGRGDPSRALRGYFDTAQYVSFAQSRGHIDQDLIDIVQQMCSRDPQMRPSLHEVADVLEDVIFKLRGQANIKLDSQFADVADRFRWSEAAHRAFGETELLVFLRGNKSSVDPKFLADALFEKRLYGFCLFRLLGSRDYLLRVWVREADRLPLQDVLERYRSNRSGEYFIFDPELRWPMNVARRGKLAYERPSDVLAAIAELASNLSNDHIRKVRRQGLILGQSKKFREQGKTRKAIRVVTRITATKGLRRELVALLGQQIFEKVSAFEDADEVEVFANTGGANGSAWFILVAEIDHFHDYRDALSLIEQTLTALTSNELFQFRSHLEMDPESHYESYDGRLFRELRRRDRG